MVMEEKDEGYEPKVPYTVTTDESGNVTGMNYRFTIDPEKWLKEHKRESFDNDL